MSEQCIVVGCYANSSIALLQCSQLNSNMHVCFTERASYEDVNCNV